jgi:hypothetical protein
VLFNVFAVAISVFFIRYVIQMTVIAGEFGRHGFDQNDLIDEARRSGAARHTRQCGRVELGLGQRQATVLFDRPDTDRAVAANAGKHDADGPPRRLSRAGAGVATRNKPCLIVNVALGGMT